MNLGPSCAGPSLGSDSQYLYTYDPIVLVCLICTLNSAIGLKILLMKSVFIHLDIAVSSILIMVCPKVVTNLMSQGHH